MEWTWLITAATGVVTALITAGLPLLARRTKKRHEIEIADDRFELELRNELRTTVDRLHTEIEVLRDEVDEQRRDVEQYRKRYEECEQGRLKQLDEIRRLRKELAGAHERITRLEDVQRRGRRLGAQT